MRSVTIVRRMPQRPRLDLDTQISRILERVLGGTYGRGWKCTKKDKSENQTENGWEFCVEFGFKKVSGHARAEEKQWQKILEILHRACNSQQFNQYPWQIVGEVPFEIADTVEIVEESSAGVQHILPSEQILTIQDLREKFPHELLNDEEGKLIEKHPAFCELFGRSAHIRMLLSAIWGFIESNGESVASHVLLYGLPACGKTALLRGIETLFGAGSVLKLDSTNTTRAGLERLFFRDLKGETPPLVFLEEIEKAQILFLQTFLSMLDIRMECRKLNFRQADAKLVKFICFATANDLPALQNMMGGKEHAQGALGSRFPWQIECPRPSLEELELILKREVANINGKPEWIPPCIELAKKLNENDPRRVISFLNGRDRLISGNFQRDYLATVGKI